MTTLLWLIPIIFTVHNAEEYLTISSHGTEHFRRLHPRQFLIAVIALSAVSYIGAFYATRGTFGLALFMQSSLLVNALIHVAATIRHRRYTPGVATAIGLFLPVSYALFSKAVGEGFATASQIRWSLLIAAFLQYPIVLLFLWIGSWFARPSQR